MKKKAYAKPMLISETFVPNEYIAVCPPGSYEEGQKGMVEPSWHGWIDSGPNGVSDKIYNSSDDIQSVTTNNSQKEPEPGTPGKWIWNETGTKLYIAYQLQNQQQYQVYDAIYIPKNNS